MNSLFLRIYRFLLMDFPKKKKKKKKKKKNNKWIMKEIVNNKWWNNVKVFINYIIIANINL